MLYVPAAQLIHPANDSFLGTFGDCRHLVCLVVERDVVEQRFLLLEHSAKSIANDHGELVSKRGIVGHHVRHVGCNQMAVTVLVLQPFSGERGASGGGAQEKPACSCIRGSPDQIADTLKSKHGVEYEEGDHLCSERGIRGPCGDERRQGAGFGDALFQDLAVLGLPIGKERPLIDRLIELSHA